MKVVLHYDAGPGLAARLGTFPGLDITICPEQDDSALWTALRDAEVLWHALKPCSAAVIAAAPKLRLIQKIGIGVNTIDLDAAAAAAGSNQQFVRVHHASVICTCIVFY